MFYTSNLPCLAWLIVVLRYFGSYDKDPFDHVDAPFWFNWHRIVNHYIEFIEL